MHSFQRLKRITAPVAALSILLISTAALRARPVESDQDQAKVTSPAVAVDHSPWLFKGSDIPPDPAWTFGTLPNGLRYAVRRNGVPPGQVAIRVAIEAGSLMEKPSERGFAHLLEHLSFRSSAHVPDGENKRIWQRLGVTFGADSNASTTFTQTSYKLDLPAATPESLDTSMKLLAGMVEQPTLTQKALDAERPVVLAEQREQPGPQVRVSEAAQKLFFRGQPLADHDPIGNIKTLEAATPAAVQAFHDRWYRPDRAVVILVGDMDPKLLEAAVIKHFSGWKADGPPPAQPDFGKPAAGGPTTTALSEPALPTLIRMAVVRPWTVGNDTVIFNQTRWIDFLATIILNRRLEEKARSGGSFITAGASLNDVSRSANITTVTILPVGNDWKKALTDVRGVIADLIANPPPQADIDREVANIKTQMQNAVDTARVEQGATIADGLVQAIDIHETLAGPKVSLDIFQGAIDKGMFTPDKVRAAMAKIFTGTATRAIINTPTPVAGVDAELATALSMPVKAGGPREQQTKVSFDALPKLGKPGHVVSRKTVLKSPDIEQVDFSNGVKLLLFPNDGEPGRVYVRVRFGDGRNALPADKPSPAWAAGLSLMASGIGKLDQDQLDRMTNGRLIDVSFSMDDDAFMLGGITSAADMKDELRLITAKLDKPGWDPRPVERTRAAALVSYKSDDSSASSVLSRDLPRLIHDGDPRWGQPDLKQIKALTPKSFRQLWEPLLASGPIEVQIYGDVKSDDAVKAVAETLGALKPRKASKKAYPIVRFPAPTDKPVVRYHDGKPDQAAAVIAWPIGSGITDIADSRKFDILTAIFRDRLLDKLRSQAGVSYTPTVNNQWPVGLNGGGFAAAVGMVPPDKTGLFFDLSKQIAADLIANPVSMDELKRALLPTIELLKRYSTGNSFWLIQSQGGTRDPARIAAINTLARDYASVTPQEIQALAAKYLQPDKAWELEVLPKPKAP